MNTAELIGQPIDRVDGRAKATGAARYAAEFYAPNLAYAVSFESTIAKGKVLDFDIEQARQVPGVVAILTHENLPKVKPPTKADGQLGQTFIPMQSDEIQYAGQHLGVVVAETFTAADRAARLVKIRYATEQPALWTGEPQPNAEFPKDAKEKPDSERGDPDAALATAPHVIRQTYWMPQETHNPMELSSTTAAWDGDQLTVYTTTQHIDGARKIIAKANRLSIDNVRVIDPYVGGAFGCKGSTWPHEYLTPVIAKVVGRPVKWVLTRSQMFTGCGGRPFVLQNIALAADQNGKLTAITHHVSNHTSQSDQWTEEAAVTSRFLYSCPNVRTTHRLVPMDSATPCQMRAPGPMPGTWALETAMDELAYACNIDPLEFRLRNYAETDQDKNKPYSSKSLRECYAAAAQRFGWSKRSPQPGSMTDGNSLIGWGMATATYPTQGKKGSVRVRILIDGTALVETASHDLGTGTYTIFTQIAAAVLGLPITSVKVELGNSAYPTAPVSGGSMTAATMGSAVHAVAEKTRTALLKVALADKASPLAGQSISDITVSNGRIFLSTDESRGESIADIMRRHGQPIDITAEGGVSAEMKKYSTHAFGAQFVEVRIDKNLKTIRVSKVVGAFAIGKVLNAKTAQSQVMGGIVGGISAALLERAVYDPNYVRIVNNNLADYLVAVNADIPGIDCFFVPEDDPHINELGAKGVGELGITGIAAAVTNAVFHATGKRIRSFPITVDKLL